MCGLADNALCRLRKPGRVLIASGIRWAFHTPRCGEAADDTVLTRSSGQAKCDGRDGQPCSRCTTAGLADECEYPIQARPGRKQGVNK